MLIIRKEQIAVFEEIAQKNFELELADHIREFIPKHAKAVGEEQVSAAVSYGVERARQYGFTNQGPVRFFIELLCLFGCDFDTDPQLPWVQIILKDEEISDQTQRADMLFDKMIEYDEKVSGLDKKFYLSALERLNSVRIEQYHLRPETFESEASRALRNIYPQKFEYLGTEGIDALIVRAKEIASELNISSDHGLGLVLAMVFAIGHGFAHDPLYPWISKALGDEERDPNVRIEDVHSKMKVYLDTVLNRRTKS
jgi:hypothetical protein